MSHLLSTISLEELHDFAVNQLGLKRNWFQDGSAPHYDVSESKRTLAIQLGAIAIHAPSKEWLAVYRKAKEIT